MDRKEALRQFIECKEMGYLKLFMPTIPAMEKAIEALQEKDHRCDNCSNGENAEGKKIFEIIEAQPQVGGWIPVTERLPENGCGVLVTVNGKHNNITFVNALEIAEYGNTEGWIIEGYLDWLDPDVIAWQPLPEPYKESEQE